MSEQKAREFWLQIEKNVDYIWKSIPRNHRECIHVIEYSAYEKLQKAFDDLAETFTRVMGVNQKMNDELAMHIKLFEQIQDWGLAGNILNYKDLTDKLEQIQENHDSQPTLNSHPENEEEAF